MNRVEIGANHPINTRKGEQFGSYEYEDEPEEDQNDYQEYYEEEQMHYPNSSSNKNSISMYDHPEALEQNAREILQKHDNDQRWIHSETENISGESDEASSKFDQRNYVENEVRADHFDNDIPNYPHGNREGYFAAQDFNEPEEKELLTITVEIGNDQQENIVIMEGETANEVAERFCNKYDMNDELRLLFTEQIEQNIEQALNEMNENEEEESQDERFENDNLQNEKFIHSDSAQMEHISTGLEPTPKQNIYANDAEINYNNTSSQKADKHSYSTPGPILINPNKGDKRTLPNKKKGNGKIKTNKSFTTLNNYTPNQSNFNSNNFSRAHKKKATRDSVYSRLHSEAIQKQKQKSNRSKASNISYEASSIAQNVSRPPKSAKKPQRGMISKPFTDRRKTSNNIGEKLYQNGLKRMEEKERKAKREKIQNELKQYESLTFQPKINSSAKRFQRNSKRLEDQLIEKGKKTHDMIEKKRSEILFEQQNRYSFRPHINKKSDRIIQERSRQFLEESSRMAESPNFSQEFEGSFMTSGNKLNKFNLLYDDAMKRMQRQDEIYSRCLDSECTFQPDVSKGNHYDGYYPEDFGNFAERLSKPSTRKEKSKIMHLQDQCYDKTTGQPLFRPRTGRPPLAKRDYENMPVTEKLYQEGQKRKHQKEEKIKQEWDRRNHSANRHKIQDKSEELLEQKKARKFHQIFQSLDVDGDGEISAEKIDISALPPEILEIFTPLLCEMEELEHTLDLEEFIDASMRLYDTLKLPDKNMILLMKDKWSIQKDNSDAKYTFHPQLNTNSLKIAAKTRASGNDIADVLMSKRLEAEAKIDEQRRIKNDEELIGCTFQPQISKNVQYQEAYRMMNVWDEEQESSANIPNHHTFSMSSLKQVANFNE
ncbi:unnamed protein product [Moneuplotes crassus]|uniref:EF-hand domain-containing protein n=1 Tax=Euplotes crassus TaxID=5936 RepID=A0AAD1Y4C3_EUPCR|nr:unnamed protein product [Moneuplotes crassus]